MKNRSILSLLLLFVVAFSSLPLKGQEGDSVVVKRNVVDSLLVGRDIFSLLNERGAAGGRVVVEQSLSLRAHFNSYLERSDAAPTIAGYRIRIFFDNARTARERSAEIVKQFEEQFPLIAVYRSYDNPYFKVTVGDFRTRSEAIKELRKLSKEFPSAFIVREEINLPPLIH